MQWQTCPSFSFYFLPQTTLGCTLWVAHALSEEERGIYYVKCQEPYFSLEVGMSACSTHSLSFSLRSLPFSPAPFHCDSCPHPQISSEPLNAINLCTENALRFLSLKNLGLLLGQNSNESYILAIFRHLQAEVEYFYSRACLNFCYSPWYAHALTAISIPPIIFMKH